MKKNITILLLEDDVNLCEIVSEFLSDQGYHVDCALDAKECLELSYTNRYDIFLFDVKVPYQNGFDLLLELRQSGIMTPTIFTTSLNTIDDLTKAYHAGCDDYLRKPFELKELDLRIQTLLKRGFYSHTSDSVSIDAHIEYDITHHVLKVHGEQVFIPKKESKILRLLIKNRGVPVTSQTIFNEAWDDDEPSELSLRTYIKNIRKILGKDRIITIRGIGYQLA